jgi:hypothetical protein
MKMPMILVAGRYQSSNCEFSSHAQAKCFHVWIDAIVLPYRALDDRNACRMYLPTCRIGLWFIALPSGRCSLLLPFRRCLLC